MTSSSPEQPRCDTELSLGRASPAPSSRCRGTDDQLKQKQQAAASPCCGGGLAATELQATAILRVARRAAAEDEDEGAVWTGLSMRRSMEWFLQLRREARHHQHGGVAAASPSSSSSLSCLTDSSRI